MKTWEILGIEATSEVSVIKRAYARKLKLYHPEDDPQGYQMLREAYDRALKLAKNNQNKEPEFIAPKEVVTEIIEEYTPEQVLVEENYNITEEDNFYMPPPVNIVEEVIDTNANRDQLVEEFFIKVADIYNNFFERLEEKKWQELLNDDIMWRFDCKELINSGMLQFLMKNYFLPKNIWNLLNKVFRWDEQLDYLRSYYPETFVNYLLIKISKQRGPRYSYFNKNIQIEYDKYIYYCEEALLALSNNDLKRADENISLAYKMYKKDPDLLCIMGEYYLRKNKIPKTLSTFKKAAKINPKDAYIYLYQVEILFNNKKYVQAYDICIKLKVLAPKNIEWRNLLGICFINISRWNSASKVFLGSLEIDPNNTETRQYLVEIAEHYRGVLKKNPSKLRVRKNLKNIYRAIGELNKIEELKITSKDILALLKKLIFRILWFIIFINSIVSGSGILAFALIVGLIFLIILKQVQFKRK